MGAVLGFKNCHELMRRGIDERLFTAATLLICRRDKILFNEPYGTLGGAGTPAVGRETLFDLASLTKVLATTPCWIMMASTDPHALDDQLLRWFPDVPNDKTNITPRHLLAHASGLPAWRPYYLHGLVDSTFQQRLSHAILAEPLQYDPGAGCTYSDLGFMLLGFIVQRQSGQSMEAYSSQAIYEPLRLESDLLFRPDPVNFSIAHTRTADAPGLVNDLNARMLGGVAGHSGLFGTARGIATLSLEILAGLKSAKSFFDRDVLRVFCRKAGFTTESTRCLGFDTPSSVGSASGRFFSSESLGHTGFTGTSVWMDPSQDVLVVLLTNRVFMGEADQRIRSFRPLLHDTIMEEISG